MAKLDDPLDRQYMLDELKACNETAGRVSSWEKGVSPNQHRSGIPDTECQKSQFTVALLVSAALKSYEACRKVVYNMCETGHYWSEPDVAITKDPEESARLQEMQDHMQITGSPFEPPPMTRQPSMCIEGKW